MSGTGEGRGDELRRGCHRLDELAYQAPKGTAEPNMDLPLDIVLLIYILAVVVITVDAVRGLRLFAVLERGVPNERPKVSVILPVKNEADTLRESLESLVALDYPSKEIILICARSTDGTAEIAKSFGDRIRVIEEPPRPDGWTGKCWACEQGFLNASGDLLLFTDGDVTHGRDSLSSSVAELTTRDIDLLSVWPRTVTRVPSERTLFPMASFFLAAGLATVGTVKTPRGRMVRGANGQYILVTRKAYSFIGGHSAVRSSIIEDGALGRNAVDNGLYVVNMDGKKLLSYKPYANFREIWIAFERFSAGILTKTSSLAGIAVASVLFFTAPLLVLAAGLLAGSSVTAYAGAIASLVSFGTTFVFYRKYSHVVYFVLTPVAGLLMVAAFISGFVKFRRSGIQWKDNTYNSAENSGSNVAHADGSRPSGH
jgi:chlorobactene glucosyltransferase